MSLLARILASKRAEIARGRPDDEAALAPAIARPAGDVAARLSRGQGVRGPLRLIAEIKAKSPSAGELSKAISAADRATAYARAGVSAVSVLCDGPFFGGSYEDVAAAVRALEGAAPAVPVLAKEFVLDEEQIEWAARHGASLALLIARIVPPLLLARLVGAARARGIEPLVEVVSEAEVEAALAAGARIVGVNVRDLDTLAMDRERAARVLSAIPAECVAVHLSGVRTAQDVRALAPSRADAVLVGEALMRLDDPAPLLAEMVRAAAGP